MSFLDDIISAGRTVGTWLGGGSIGASLARTAITGYALNKLTQSINPANTVGNTDSGARQQVEAKTDNSIPVVYGTAYVGGIITDAVLTQDNSTMYFCLTLSEKTGNTGLGAGPASVFTFGDIYRDDMRLIFQDDGITVSKAVDRDGKECGKPAGKIRVWCFNNGSASPVVPENYTNNSLQTANTIFPDWTTDHDMTGLVFAIVRIDYDATNDIRSLGSFRFQLKNTMSLPGDCLYDYMTNTVYGAGIPAEGIYVS